MPEDVGPAEAETVILPRTPDEALVVDVARGLDSFLIVGGLYSVTALRENDQGRVTIYTKHRQWAWASQSLFLFLGHMKDTLLALVRYQNHDVVDVVDFGEQNLSMLSIGSENGYRRNRRGASWRG